jgi:CRISPR/Cas system-associated exonuclease Cas4 (RecB family)
VGTAVHKVLEKAVTEGLVEGKDRGRDLAVLMSRLEAEWGNVISEQLRFPGRFLDWGPSGGEVAARNEAKALLVSGYGACVRAGVFDRSNKNVVSEKVLECEHEGDLLLTTRVDLIFDYRDGTLAILDLKTTKYGVRYLNKDQLVFSAWLTERASGRAVDRVAWVLLRSGEIVSMEPVGSDYDRVRASVDALRRSCSEDSFDASPSPQACRFCAYNTDPCADGALVPWRG